MPGVESESSLTKSILKNIFKVQHWVLLLFSVFFSFKVNNGFNLWSLIIAIVFPPFYVLYVLATNDLESLSLVKCKKDNHKIK